MPSAPVNADRVKQGKRRGSLLCSSLVLLAATGRVSSSDPVATPASAQCSAPPGRYLCTRLEQLLLAAGPLPRSRPGAGTHTVSDSSSDRPRSTKAECGAKPGVRASGGACTGAGFQKLFGGYFLTDILTSFSGRRRPSALVRR